MNGNGVKAYWPRREQKAILDRAFELVQGVPYQVSARWLFYALLQEGTYPDKESYKGKLLPLLAKARKCFYKDWRPDTLSDDTREAIIRGDGFLDEIGWLEAVGQAECRLDKWVNQKFYVELWFEAKAMRGQFEHYTDHITLRPFGGDPSIPYKWAIAKELEQASEDYEIPIIIIYFGDLDPKGLTIPESAVRDIRDWCKVGFEFIRGGLNPGDEVRYSIMENPEKPGTYQWEALSDEVAGEVITREINRFISQGSFSETEQAEQDITESFQERWQRFITGG
ncbi:MAG: hypothetical protein D4R73_08560 [Deltaproteobacteria bacterium]|nr:MAG: hypothetical protein D4R73_08560 [Deltaproteobacteria bacterium]